MRIGCCGSPKSASQLKELGFQYIEVNVQEVLLGDVGDAEWARTVSALGGPELPMEAANCLLPGNCPVIGPERDHERLVRYMSRVAHRAHALGISRIVFGSGGARRLPDGVAPEQGERQIVEFLRIAGEACARHDVMVVIEPLNRNETNTLNDVTSAVRVARQAAESAVAVLVDSYHYCLEHDTEDALLEAGPLLRHVHVAEPIDRIEPGGHAEAEKSFDFAAFFRTLRKIGYDERVSFEGRFAHGAEEGAARCIAFLREAWRRAGV
jgi:sugar phosphate isomerase/epimerase